MAIPISLKGIAACDFADDLGLQVSTVAANREGFRLISTAEARAFIAERPGSSAWASVIWIVTGYDISRMC
jgi:hypothetical protein